jgi:hypothetical protein
MSVQLSLPTASGQNSLALSEAAGDVILRALVSRVRK